MALGGPQRNSRILHFFLFFTCMQVRIVRQRFSATFKKSKITRLKSKCYENKVETLRE